jgi:hypothetical protein
VPTGQQTIRTITTVKLDDAGLLLALAAAARAYAPDVRTLMRRLLGAGVRVGAATLMERHHPTPPAARPHVPGLDEGDHQ